MCVCVIGRREQRDWLISFQRTVQFYCSGLPELSFHNKIPHYTFHFNISDLLLAMSYRERPEFVPEEHGLGADFRLTNFSKLKG